MMDHFSHPVDRRFYLLFGVFILAAGAAFMLTGETLERYRGIVRRDEDPKRYWWDVVMWFLFGLFFIGLYFYQKSN